MKFPFVDINKQSGDQKKIEAGRDPDIGRLDEIAHSRARHYHVVSVSEKISSFFLHL